MTAVEYQNSLRTGERNKAMTTQEHVNHKGYETGFCEGAAEAEARRSQNETD